MTKIVTNLEIAEIFLQLLVQPDAVGGLSESQTYAEFLTGSSRVIAEFCGGEISGSSFPDLDNPMDDADISHLYTVGVYPNDSLPSLSGCIWSPFDPNGWNGEIHEAGEAPDSTPESEKLMRRIQLLKQATGEIERILMAQRLEALKYESTCSKTI